MYESIYPAALFLYVILYFQTLINDASNRNPDSKVKPVKVLSKKKKITVYENNILKRAQHI